MAATRRIGRLLRNLLRLLGGLLAAGPATALTLPEDRAEALLHVYDGGGVRATGPALLVRKSLADRVSLSGTYYVDMVSNASIDVVTTASPYREKRSAYALGLDHVYRDAQITLGVSSSQEPDYSANAATLDIAQEVFGGMTTVNLGFTRGRDQVGKHGDPGFFDHAAHWQYRVGVAQILSPRWLASANLEAVSDEGFLGSPYRAALVFGALVPERVPRTRSSRALKLRSIHDTDALLSRSALRAEYRYYWDNWDVRAHTLEASASRYFGERWLADIFLRYHSQSKALFYSDNATAETTYVTRNRQLGTFTSPGLGARASWTLAGLPAQYSARLTGSYEFKRFNYSDFTDLRTGKPYAHDAHLLQVYLSATY